MDRVLVAYATRFGSTEEVAQRIGTVLSSESIQTDVRAVEEITSLRDYDAIVIGSAIRVGRWVPEAVDFLREYEAELRDLPVAYFTVCMTLNDNTPENHFTVQHYHDPLIKDFPDIHPLTIGMFAGRYDYNQLPLSLRLLGKVMRVPGGDFRNWDEIEAWACDLAVLLKEQGVVWTR